MSSDGPAEAPRFGDGRFEPTAELGVRANGGVFLAFDHVEGDECVLKLLDESVVPEEAVQRFQAEARVLLRLSHPHLVHARGHGRDHGFSWYAMEVLPGGSLQDLMRERGKLPPPIALALVFQVLLGLGALHAAGLVHRDVKLSNALLDVTGRARVSDLGIAHHPTGEVGFETHTGERLGTPGYGAPEQWEHAGKVGPTADLFATGVLLYRLLTRRPPDRLHLAHYRPSLLRDVPEATRDVVLHATRYLPEERYPDARSMGEAVARSAKLLTPTIDVDAWMAQFDDPTDPDPWDIVRQFLWEGS